MRRLDENYEFLEVDPNQWFNLLSTLPQLSSKRGILFLLYQGFEIIQAFHSLQGTRPDLTGPISTPSVAIQQLHEREDVEAVIMVEQGLAVYLLAKMQAAFSPEMDILQYIELAQTSIKEELGRRYHVWPQQFMNKGLLSLFQRIRILLNEFPPNFICVLTIFEENDVWTSLIVESVDGQIRRITSVKLLEPFEFTIDEWQTDYPKLLKAIAERFAQPTLGFFTDDETFRFLLRSEAPLEFIRQARRSGQIIIDPIPGRIRSRI